MPRRNKNNRARHAVKIPLKVQVIECAECGSPMVLRNGKFGRKFYGCTRFPLCTGTHGAHENGSPLGTPANKETKEWRIKAHNCFDQFRHDRRISRSESYRRLWRAMGITKKECHIALFDIEHCKRVIACVKEGLLDERVPDVEEVKQQKENVSNVQESDTKES